MFFLLRVLQENVVIELYIDNCVCGQQADETGTDRFMERQPK